MKLTESNKLHDQFSHPYYQLYNYAEVVAFQFHRQRHYATHSLMKYLQTNCCDMGQNDTVGKIELKPSIVLSSDNTNCKNDIQLFHQLFDELSVHTDYH